MESDMHYQTRLQRRGSTYYFRARVPSDLIARVGKREIKISLKTKDRAEAVRLVRQKSAEIDKRFDQARAAQSRGRTPAVASPITDETIRSVCELYAYHTLDGDQWYRGQGISDAEFDDLSAQRAETEVLLRRALAQGQLEVIRPALDSYLHLLNLHLAGDDEAYRRLAYAFLETVTETHTLQRQRDAGTVVRTPQIPDVTLGGLSEAAIPWNDLLEAWVAGLSTRDPKTTKSVRREVATFERVIGPKSVANLTRGDAVTYRDHLLKEGLHWKTVRKRLGFLGAICQLAVDDEKLERNVFSRVRVPRPKAEPRPRVKYEVRDLTRIFGCRLFTDGERPRASGGEAAVWLPALALYTGAREEELARLRVADIQCYDHIDYIDITDLSDDVVQSTTKTDSSVRHVPIHAELVRAGFLRYVTQIKAKHGDLLFPGLRADCNGKLSGNWAKWWSRYCRREIGVTDKRKVFHSFRHGFKSACREAGIEEEVHDAITGHEGGGVGRIYGDRPPLKVLRRAVARVRYPGFSLPVITP